MPASTPHGMNALLHSSQRIELPLPLGIASQLKLAAEPAKYKTTMPSPLTPDQILELAPKQSRPLLVEANTIAYFDQLFKNLRTAISTASTVTPVTSVRKDQ